MEQDSHNLGLRFRRCEGGRGSLSMRVVKVLKYHISVYIITGLREYLRGGGKGAF